MHVALVGSGSWRHAAATLLVVVCVTGEAATQTAPAQPAAPTQSAAPPPPPAPSPYAAVVRQYLWPVSEMDYATIETRLKSDQSFRTLSRIAFLDLEEQIRRGSPRWTADAVDTATVQELTVEVPSGPPVPVLVQLPPHYTAATEWPLMFAMHGGPPGQATQARSGAERMLRVWKEAAATAGWIVAAPALTPSVTAGARTDERLPYEVFHPEQARAVIDALRQRFRINPDRIVSTGISLGSNYSLAFAAGEPGWLSAIVPVSTEGDSREHFARNFLATPIYVLEGTRDRNIRMIDGPRRLAEMVSGFGYDITYREFTDRAHEGFQEHYDDVLRWLDARPRQSYAREVVRVPHAAIVPVSRRVQWLESDTRQGLVRAVVTAPDRIAITARWARKITLFLHDRIVDLEKPITVTVNGAEAFNGVVARSAVTALEEVKRWGDERRVYAAKLTVDVPNTARANAAAEALTKDLAVKRPEGTLSFWEMYATRALEERLPDAGFEATEIALPGAIQGAADQVALRVTSVRAGSALELAGLRSGDVIVEFGGEPFFKDRGVAHLHHWLMRELRSTPLPYVLNLVRDGKAATLDARLQLGRYATPPSAAGNR